MIPVHLVEYRSGRQSVKSCKDLGRYIVGGKDCKIRSILRPNEVKATEKFARRESNFYGIEML